MKRIILLDGIAGWASVGEDYAGMTVGYESHVWKK